MDGVHEGRGPRVLEPIDGRVHLGREAPAPAARRRSVANASRLTESVGQRASTKACAAWRRAVSRSPRTLELTSRTRTASTAVVE